MVKPIALVAKPKIDEQIREDVTLLLRETLAQAERGEIQSVAIILENTDGNWSNCVSDAMKFSDAIGRLEITKQEWIAQYLRERGRS